MISNEIQSNQRIRSRSISSATSPHESAQGRDPSKISSITSTRDSDLVQENLNILLSAKSKPHQLKDALAILTELSLNYENFSKIVKSVRETLSLPSATKQSLRELGRHALDCAGTGGSGRAHFNTSTASAFVLSAAGIAVAKFGARAATGKSGSIDFLSSLGIAGQIEPASLADLLAENRLCFLSAQEFYPQLAHLSPIRKELGYPTIMNFIGPLLNPIFPKFRIMGVACSQRKLLITRFLATNAEQDKALIYTGAHGFDELIPGRENCIDIIERKRHTTMDITDLPLTEEIGSPASSEMTTDSNPSEIGLEPSNSDCNAEIFMRILNRKDSVSESYKSLLLNSGAGMFAVGSVPTILAGTNLAKELIADGTVLNQLTKYRRSHVKFSA